MTLAPLYQWAAFVAAAIVAIGGALGMTTTMSMFRSGIFLMASFIGVAALFILLSADLLALLQVMMYVGGMLVMILFMVLFMHDPGGAMMAGMKMNRLERFFTRGIVPMNQQMGDSKKHGPQDSQDEHGSSDEHGAMEDMDMSMTTPIKRHAAVVALLSGALLIALILLRSAWPVNVASPSPQSAARVGHLLMDKYMMAFEGAGMLILIGIFGAVLLSRGGRHPDAAVREHHVAVGKPPVGVDQTPLEVEAAPAKELIELNAIDIHGDRGKEP